MCWAESLSNGEHSALFPGGKRKYRFLKCLTEISQCGSIFARVL